MASPGMPSAVHPAAFGPSMPIYASICLSICLSMCEFTLHDLVQVYQDSVDYGSLHYVFHFLPFSMLLSLRFLLFFPNTRALLLFIHYRSFIIAPFSTRLRLFSWYLFTRCMFCCSHLFSYFLICFYFTFHFSCLNQIR